ncbi:MAG: ECF transporter S component [Bacilli bacterium]|nr:ECF transporter S component [Bacilli bacterium]
MVLTEVQEGLTREQISWIVLGASLVATIVFVILYSKYMKKKEFSWARFAARVAIFGALSTILYVVPVFQLKLPFLPAFLELHFDEVPAFIAGYAYGPFTALIVILVKTLIKLPFSNTLCVGELADFIFSSAFVLPAAFIYKKIRNLKGVFIGFGVSFVLQILVASLMNVYAILPFYMQVMNYPYDVIMNMCSEANPLVKNLGLDFVLWVVVPLNVIKNTIVLVLTYFIYKGIHKSLRWEKPEQKEELEVVDVEAK